MHLAQAGNYGMGPPEFPTKVYVSGMLDRVLSVDDKVHMLPDIAAWK